MDPTATWGLLCEALQLLQDDPNDTDARDLAIECFKNLARWLRNGGFPPRLGG